jgi:histidinol-phosphatase
VGLDQATLAAARATALQAADAADAIALARFGSPLRVDTKPGGTPVTEADTAIERELGGLIGEAHPEHATMGEEGGGGLAADRPTWVIDPIDGTKNFLRGVPVFATLIALVAGGEAVVGVVSAPALGERTEGAAGLGVRRNGVDVAVSGVADLADAHVSLGDIDRLQQPARLWAGVSSLTARAWHARAFGDFWSHGMVAAGSCDVAVEREIEVWDVAAPACLVAEAGGRVTDLAGTPVLASAAPAPNAVVATNGLLHDAVLSELAQPLAPSRDAPA